MKLNLIFFNKCWCSWVANATGLQLIELSECRFEFSYQKKIITFFPSPPFEMYLLSFTRDSYHLPSLQKDSSSNQKKIITFFPSPPFEMFWSNLHASLTKIFRRKLDYHLPPLQKDSSSNQEKIITFFPSPPFEMFWSNLHASL